MKGADFISLTRNNIELTKLGVVIAIRSTSNQFTLAVGVVSIARNKSLREAIILVHTMELDVFIGRLQQFGKTSTSIVFSTEVETRGVDVGSEQD